jgi:hypothetical protein
VELAEGFHGQEKDEFEVGHTPRKRSSFQGSNEPFSGRHPVHHVPLNRCFSLHRPWFDRLTTLSKVEGLVVLGRRQRPSSSIRFR